MAAIAVVFLDLYLMALRTSLLFRSQAMPLPVATALRLTLVSSWFALFSPGAAGGDIAKVFYATREARGRRAEITVILLLDRAIGLLSLLLLPLLMVPFFWSALEGARQLRELLAFTAGVAGVALLAFLACLYSDPLSEALGRGGDRPDRRPERLLRALATLRSYRKHPGTLLLSLLIALCDNCLVVVLAALALLALRPSVLSSKLALVVPLGTVANSLPLTPGGLGVGEAAFNKVFALAGLSLGAEALVCTRIWRAIAAIPGLFLYLRGVGPITFDREGPGRDSSDLP